MSKEKVLLNEEDLNNVAGGNNAIPIGGNYGKTFICMDCHTEMPGSDIGILKCFCCGSTNLVEKAYED